MDIHAGQQPRFPAATIAVVLLMLCIFPGQSWITQQFPTISGLAQIRPSLVFLDIPIPMPVPIDLILVPGLFLLTYLLVIVLYPSRVRRRPLQRLKAASMGLLVILFSMLTGALIYYLAQEHLPKQIQNGINSLGVIADIHLSYPGYETIPLRGSMVLFICLVIGMDIFIRKIRKEPASRLTREQRMTPYERMLQEKQMKEKQVKQEARMIQQQGRHQADKGWQPVSMEQAGIALNPNTQARLCHSTPINLLRPEAVAYMPM